MDWDLSNARNSFELLSAEPLIAVLIGPGGVGKGTLAQRLVTADPQLQLSRSWTTRPQRASERGDEYVFVDRAGFEHAIDEGRFLEWTEFQENLYGTPRPSLDVAGDVLLEIEVRGAEQIRHHHADAAIFLVVPPSLAHLEERLRARGDSDEHVRARLASTPQELDRGHHVAGYVIVNDDLERATGEILSILEELRWTRRTSSPKD